MNGTVDEYGRAIVQLSIRAPAKANSDDSTTDQLNTIDAWIDTGFNGDLVMPRDKIDSLGLPPSGTVKAILADGSEVALTRYSCRINWLGKERELEVVANEGEFPLLGVGMLIGYDLHISYRTGNVTIE